MTEVSCARIGKGKLLPERAVNAFVLDLYDAVLEPARWHGIAPKFAALLGGDTAGLQTQNLASGYVNLLSASAVFGPAAQDAYREHYAKKEVLISRAMRRRLGGAVASHELISDAEWEETEIYRDFLSHYGIFRTVGAVFDTGANEIGIIAAHRARHSAPFDDAAKQKVDTIVGHARRAFQMHRRLHAATIDRRGASEILERSGMNIILVDRAARILFATSAAERFLQASQDITAIAGRLIAASVGSNQRLMQAIQGAVNVAAGAVQPAEALVAVPRPAGRPLAVMVVPFVPREQDLALSEPGALLMVRDPEVSTPTTGALRELFGLTPTEAAIAAALVDGKSLQEIAAASGTTFHTVRSHMKAITQKTGTRRQSDLIALILRSISGLIRPPQPGESNA
jgi:DNA-binding CsgD family transcriptional regulator